MNAPLVYPEFPATFWNFKHALKFVGKKSSLPPLGLLTVAAMLALAVNLAILGHHFRKVYEKDAVTG